MDLVEITRISSSTSDTIDFLRNRNLLRQNMICCQQNCHDVKCKTSDGIEFKCSVCKARKSIRTGSIFFNVHIQLKYLLLLTFLFCTETSVKLTTTYLGSKVSLKSIAMWFDQLRIVMSNYLTSNPIQLGGEDTIVEIDETCLGRKRKYNRGAIRNELQWILGLIDRRTKKVHIQLVDRRNRQILLPIIEQHVLQNTIIHTDEAPVYAILNQRGFEHYTVCHRDTYVAPDGTHTNTIENLWYHLKNTFKEKHGVMTDKIPAHVDEFIYRWNRKSEGPVFELIIRDILTQYPL